VSLSFTTGADDLIGGAGNDTFTGLLASTSTFATGDKVKGGEGIDKIVITNSAVTSAPMVEISEVETVEVKQLVSTSLDAILWAGVQKVVSSGGVGGTTLTLTNVAKSPPAIEIDGGSLVTSQHLSVSMLDLTGASDSASVSLTNTSASTITLSTGAIGALETLTLSAPGSGVVTLTGSAFSASTALTIQGGAAGSPMTLNVDAGAGAIGNVTFSGAASSTSITFASGSANQVITTGGARDVITFTGSAGNKTITTGDGNDSVVFSSTLAGSAGTVILDSGSGDDSITLYTVGNHSLTMGAGADTVTGNSYVETGDTINGGDGNDRISFTAGTGTTAPTLISVETATITWGANGRAVSLANASGVTSVTVGGSAANALLTNAPATLGTVTFNKGNSLAAQIKYAEGANATLALNFVSGNGNGGSVLLDEVGSVTIDSTGIVSTSTDASAALFGTITLNSGSDEDPISVTINSRSGGSLNLASTSNASSLLINNYNSQTFTLSSFGGGSGLSTITLNAVSAGIALQATAVETPNASYVVTAGSATTVSIPHILNTDPVNATSITLTLGCGSTVNIDELTLAQVGNAAFTISNTNSGATVLIGTSAMGAVASGLDNVGIHDEFYAVLDARSLGDGSLKMATATLFSGVDASITGYAGTGEHVLRGYSGNSQAMTIYGARSGVNILIGGDGADSIFGGVGADTIIGGKGNDYLSGGKGDDVIFTDNAGSDTVIGGDGADTIWHIGRSGTTAALINGGSGADTIHAGGSSSSDTIVWTVGDDTYSVGTVITGWSADKIDLTGTTTAFTVAATSTATANGSGSVVPFSAAGTLTVLNVAPQSASEYIVNGSANTFFDFWSGADFAMLFGTGSAGGVNYPLAASVTGIDASSGYGIAFNGSSGASAIVGVQASGGDTYLLLMSINGSGTQTLSTANITSVIHLDGWTGSFTLGNWG